MQVERQDTNFATPTTTLNRFVIYEKELLLENKNKEEPEDVAETDNNEETRNLEVT
jgi:hypothetical protein